MSAIRHQRPCDRKPLAGEPSGDDRGAAAEYAHCQTIMRTTSAA